MVFSSEIFLFIFLPITLLFYLIFKRGRNIILLIASLIFYAWGEPVYIILMLISIAVNYLFGLLIENTKISQDALKCNSRIKPHKIGILWQSGGGKHKLIFIISIVFNIGLLGVFKYTGFVVENLNRLGLHISDPGIVLPIGISFYTFQILSYVIDVYRGNVNAQKDIFKLGLYISLFPQLIAGPIVRYSDIEKEIHSRTISWDDLYHGSQRFMKGFAKKILIADRVSEIADYAFGVGNGLSMNMAWLGALAYTIQIYFDFSGYSDMAIGLGRMFGFHFLENFNFPYISKNVREFWRRWHMSLGGWFRDYVYIPLGGSRCSLLRTCINTIIVFFLTGLWHGASWNFIMWGLWYAIFMVIERIVNRKFELKHKNNFIAHLYALFIIILGWVLFRADNLHAALSYWKAMFTPFIDNSIVINITAEQITFLIIGCILAIIPPNISEQKWIKSKIAIACKPVLIILLFIIAIMYMVGAGFSPFLYFRF